MKKSLAALALAGSVVLVGAVPAVADHNANHQNTNYPAPQAIAAVSNASPGAGETFTFRGRAGFFFNNEPLVIDATEAGTPSAAGTGGNGGASRVVTGKITLPLALHSFRTAAAADGSFAYELSLPEAGTYTLTATGLTSGKSTSATITVVGAALANNSSNSAPKANTVAGTTNAGNELANTGADTNLVLWSLVGAGALAAGVSSVVVVRRRAKADASA